MNFLLCVGFFEPNGTSVKQSHGGQFVGKRIGRCRKRNERRHISTTVITVLVTAFFTIGLLHGKPSKEHQLNRALGHGTFAFHAAGCARVPHTLAKNDKTAFEAHGVAVDHFGGLNVENGSFPITQLFVCFPIRFLTFLAAVHDAFTATTEECRARFVAHTTASRFSREKLLQKLSRVFVVMMKQRCVIFHEGAAAKQRLQLLVLGARIAQANVISLFWATRVALQHRFYASFFHAIQ